MSTDRDAVVDVVNFYTYALDEREWRLLDHVFTADAVGYYGGPGSAPLEGRAAVVASIRSFLDGCGPTQHLLGNHIVTIDGDKAVARCKARIYHYGAGERAALPPTSASASAGTCCAVPPKDGGSPSGPSTCDTPSGTSRSCSPPRRSPDDRHQYVGRCCHRPQSNRRRTRHAVLVLGGGPRRVRGGSDAGPRPSCPVQ
ncbi:nuclear transport factor 2 family protein [Streptomyces sp. NPDC055681]